MKPQVKRIIEAILHLVHEAHKRKITLTQYEIAKSIFLADKSHLNKYGRPITYDNYVAMKHGPVPSLVYDVLKENPKAMNKYGIKSFWTRRLNPNDPREKEFLFESAKRPASESILSPSDLIELDAALTIVKTLGFRQIRKLTHEDPAYIDAWEDEGTSKQYPMSYSLLFESPNEPLARELAFFSNHL